MIRTLPRRRFVLAATASLTGAVSGCSTVPRALGGGASADPTRLVVVGTATYRERVTLPPNAMFEASLLDVSLADAPAVVLATSRLYPADELPPYRYELNAPRGALPPSARVIVSARITVAGQLWFITPEAHTVAMDRVGPQTIDVLLRAVTTAPRSAPR